MERITVSTLSPVRSAICCLVISTLYGLYAELLVILVLSGNVAILQLYTDVSDGMDGRGFFYGFALQRRMNRDSFGLSFSDD